MRRRARPSGLVSHARSGRDGIPIVTGTGPPELRPATASLLARIAPRLGLGVHGVVDDVYVVHPTGPPVNENLIDLLLVLDAADEPGPSG